VEPPSVQDPSIIADNDLPAFDVRVLRSYEELEQARDLWGAWPRPDADLDFFTAVARSRPEVSRPHVLLILRDGKRAGMAVGRLERIPLECSIGYRVVHKPLVRSISIVPDGVAYSDDPDVLAALVQELRAALVRGEADMVDIAHVPTGSLLHRTALEVSSPLFRQHAARIDPHWTAVIPDSLEAFLGARSRNTRENVKRYSKRLLREFGERLSVETFESGADSDRLFGRIEPVAAKTYQRRLGAGFADTEEQRRLVELGLERGWFRAWVLSIDDEPQAFWHGMAYAGTFFIGSPGYDPALAQHRIGMFLQIRMIEDLCSDPDVHAIDYGFGFAQYKRSFGDEFREETDVRLFARTPRGAWLNLAKSSTLALDQLAKSALRRAGVAERIKRAARRGGDSTSS
jgi:hypothetical protein